MRRGIRNILLAAVTGATVGAAPGPQQESPCQEWPTEEFFKEATVAQVVACLEAGADPTAQYGYWYRTALHMAARASPEPLVIKILLDAGVDVDARGLFDKTPLQDALGYSDRGDPAVIEALLAAGADPNVRGSTGWTPLHTAAVEAEDARIIKALLAAGAERGPRTGGTPHDAGGETPLHIAVRNGAAPAAVEALLDAGADVRARDEYGYTPLYGAKGAVAELLLAAGIGVDERSGPGLTPLHVLADAGLPVIKRLLDGGADVHARDDAGRTPLHYVAGMSDDAAAVELLLAAEADPKAQDDAGRTPLHAAALGSGGPALFQALVAAGADVDGRDKDGETPVYLAARNDENPAAFQALVDAGADIDARDDDGRTLLHAAAHGENPTVVEALLAVGADVNARDTNDETPLHVAARYSGWVEDLPSPIGSHPGPVYESTAVVAALLAAGADVNARSTRGWTPLLWAAELNKNPTVLELLLAAGADRDARIDNGETPLSIANGRLPLEIREVLRAHPLPARVPATAVQPVEVVRDCPTCPELVVVPAGRFRMGCVFESHACRSKSTLPAHEVDVASFALSKFEVTRRQFAAFVAATGYHPAGGCEYEPGSWRDQSWQRDDHPVVCVNWDDAQAYVQWLREETGYRYRLPTEAEWEYAVRAGTKTRFHWGYRVPDLCTYENAARCDDAWERTAPVGSFRANGFGLHDMAGNVSEWVADCWHENYDGAPRDGSAWIRDGDCSRRVVRGCHWGPALPRHCRSADRDEFEVGFRFVRLGFRVARTLGAPQDVQRPSG